MANNQLTPSARHIEARLQGDNSGLLDKFARAEAVSRIEAQGYSPSEFVLTATRQNILAGNRTLAPKTLRLGSYGETELYGASGSPQPRFRSAIKNLASKANQISQLVPSDIEYAHQTSLFWADVCSLKEFLSISPIVAEIVAELRTAKYQMIGKDTPIEFLNGVKAGLDLINSASRFDTELIDNVVLAMETGGFDSFAPDALRSSDE